MSQNGESDPQAIEEIRKDALNNLARLTRDSLTRIRNRLDLNPKKAVNKPKTLERIYKILPKIPEFTQAVEQCQKLGLDEKDMGPVIIKEVLEWVSKQRKV